MSGRRELRANRRVNALRASSACASALPGDTPPVPPLGEQLWALRPRLDGGVPAVNGSTPDARRAVDGWAGACAVTWRSGGRKRGGFLAAEASSYGHSPPTPVSGDPDFRATSARSRTTRCFNEAAGYPRGRHRQRNVWILRPCASMRPRVIPAEDRRGGHNMKRRTTVLQ